MKVVKAIGALVLGFGVVFALAALLLCMGVCLSYRDWEGLQAASLGVIAVTYFSKYTDGGKDDAK